MDQHTPDARPSPKGNLTSLSLVALMGFLVSVAGSATLAQPLDPDELSDLFDMSLEDLMEMPIASATSRLPQESGELPSSPMTIVTAEDIHYSGLTSIPDVLRFFCGVDVLQIDRRRHAIGIHGLHETFSDRTTLLVDGRFADNPVYGGPDFQGLPLMIEDIERIEIVRSPGSAAWGANALTGVINIVTKKPSTVSGTMAKTTVNEFGDSYSHLRYAHGDPNLSWRISVGYEDIESSEDAIDGTADYVSANPAINGLIGFNTYEARDFARNRRIDSEIHHRISESTQLLLGMGHTHIEAGDFELGGYFPREDIREDHVRSYTKLDHRFENDNSAHLQWSGKFWTTNWPMATQLSTAQNELEAQYNFAPEDGHHTSVGASFRWDRIKSDPPASDPQQARLAGEPLDEDNLGLFAIHRWNVTPHWTLEGQARGDWYSATEGDWSGRLTTLHALDTDKRHILRLSAARAISAPLPELREASSTRVPMGGGLYMANLIAPDHLDNEEIYCFEAGWTAQLTKTVSLHLDTFYQKFKDLIGLRATTNMLGQVFVTPDNLGGADAWGGDLELAVDRPWGKVAAWYSFNDFQTEHGDQNVGAFLPAKHKAGVRFRRQFRPGWTVNVNYTYADTTEGGDLMGGNDVGVVNRLDLTISKAFAQERGELMVGVSDLLENTHDPVRESTTYTAHEVPGRTCFLSLRLKF